jgi:hypothetical protein
MVTLGTGEHTDEYPGLRIGRSHRPDDMTEV